jgi:hypothetical protein
LARSSEQLLLRWFALIFARLGIKLSFPVHPLSDILRAIHDRYTSSFTASQEPDYLYINERYFPQVQNKLRPITLELPVQFSDVLRLKVTNQTNCRGSAVPLRFDLQCLLTKNRGLAKGGASDVPKQSIEWAQLTIW